MWRETYLSDGEFQSLLERFEQYRWTRRLAGMATVRMALYVDASVEPLHVYATPPAAPFAQAEGGWKRCTAPELHASLSLLAGDASAWDLVNMPVGRPDRFDRTTVEARFLADEGLPQGLAEVGIE